MKWKVPPEIKVYEALGAIADARIEMKNNTAKVVSSSRGKVYEVMYDADRQAIASNDNGSYWQGYLGYPAIAFLMKIGLLQYDGVVAEQFKGIAWKDINTTFKNDFAKTEIYLQERLGKNDWAKAQKLASEVLGQIKQLSLNKLVSKAKPPQGY